MSPFLGTYASQISGHLTPPSSFESIQTGTGTGSNDSFTFSSIPSTYKSLQIRISATLAASGGEPTGMYLRINGDSGSNYSRHHLNGDGSTATAAGYATSSLIFFNTVYFAKTYPSTFIIDILDYNSTSKYKTVRYFAGTDKNGSGNVALGSGLWQSTSAINSLYFQVLSGGMYYSTDSTFALYGVN